MQQEALISAVKEDLVEQHAHWLRRVISARMFDSVAVDDILQEVSLAVLRSSKQPDDPQAIKRWLCRIAINQCALAVREQSRIQQLASAAGSRIPKDEASRSDPMLWLIAHEESATVRAGMEQVAPEARQILIWKFVQKCTYSQIGERLNITKDSAEYQVLKARNALREILIQLGLGEDEQP